MDNGPKHPTVAVPGIYANDMRFTGLKSTGLWRTSKRNPPKIGKLNSGAKPTGGYVRESTVIPPIKGSMSKSAAKHARKRLAKGTQRRKHI